MAEIRRKGNKKNRDKEKTAENDGVIDNALGSVVDFVKENTGYLGRGAQDLLEKRDASGDTAKEMQGKRKRRRERHGVTDPRYGN